MSNALKAGFRHLDFAMMYGNQPEIGEALTTVFKEGKVKREDVWMTSKVPPSLHRPQILCQPLGSSLADWYQPRKATG